MIFFCLKTLVVIASFIYTIDQVIDVYKIKLSPFT